MRVEKTESDHFEVICPHCDARYQPEPDDYSEDEREQECSRCRKTYIIWQEFTVTHCTRAEVEP